MTGWNLYVQKTVPAFGHRRQPELCQQAAGVAAQDGAAVAEDGPWDETAPLFYEMHDATNFCCV